MRHITQFTGLFNFSGIANSYFNPDFTFNFSANYFESHRSNINLYLQTIAMKMIFSFVFLLITAASLCQPAKDTSGLRKSPTIASIYPDNSHFRYFVETSEVAKVTGYHRDTLIVVMESIYQYRLGIRYIKIGDRIYSIRETRKKKKVI